MKDKVGLNLLKNKVLSFGHLKKTTLNLIFIPALILMLFISFFLYHQVTNLIVANNWIIHTEEVIRKTESSLFQLLSIESYQRAFLITGEEQFLSNIDVAKKELNEKLTEVKTLTADNLEQNERVKDYSELVDQRLNFLNNTIKLKRTSKFNSQEGLDEFKRGQEISTRAQGLGQEIKSVEAVLLQERNKSAVNRADVTNIILIIGSCISLGFLLTAFVLASSELTIRNRTEQLNKKSELQLRSVIESASEMIAALDKENRFIIFNQPYQHEFKRIFHKSINIGMSLKEIIKDASADQQLLAPIAAGNDLTRNVELLVDDEKLVYEIIVSTIQNDRGEVEGSVHVIRNITKRIQEHDELQSSYQSLATGIAKLEEKNKQITMLVELSEIMLACSSPDELSNVMSKYSSRMLPFAAGCLYMMHPSKNYLEIIAHWGDAKDPLQTFTPDQCWAIRRGRLHQVNTEHLELICDHITHLEKHHIALCVPLMAQNDIYGMFYLELGQKEGEHIEDHKLLINAFAELTALALANVRLRENLRYQSIRDPLTGLYNRRYLEDFLFKQLHQASRTDTALSVLMLDLDHFKKLNDTYGHDAGDMALKECSKIMQHEIRSSDIVARYGGEEFILVLYGADATAASIRAEKIRNEISMVQIHYGAQIVGPLTVSIGIADYPNDESTMEALIEAADRALYHAKNNGRNRIELASKINQVVVKSPLS